MPIALDSLSNGGNGTAATLTWAHTCSGSNTILIVAATAGGFISGVSGVTYNGKSLTKLAEQDDPFHPTPAYRSSLWYIINPDAGTNNIVVSSSSGTTDGIGAVAASYTGVRQTSQPDSFASSDFNGGSTPTAAFTTTVIDNNCWLVGLGVLSEGSSVITAGPVTTIRQHTEFSGTYNSFSLCLADSNSIVVPGSQSLNYQGSGQVTYIWTGIVASIAATNSSAPSTNALFFAGN